MSVCTDNVHQLAKRTPILIPLHTRQIPDKEAPKLLEHSVSLPACLPPRPSPAGKPWDRVAVGRRQPAHPSAGQAGGRELETDLIKGRRPVSYLPSGFKNEELPTAEYSSTKQDKKMSPHIQRNYDNCAAMLPSSDLVTFDFATLIPWVNSGSEILYPQYNELHTEKRYPAKPNIEILNEKKQCRFGCYVQTEQKVVQYWVSHRPHPSTTNICEPHQPALDALGGNRLLGQESNRGFAACKVAVNIQSQNKALECTSAALAVATGSFLHVSVERTQALKPSNCSNIVGKSALKEKALKESFKNACIMLHSFEIP
ncbi:hypothetical protein Anapl_04642 [Anas platyrhynchos]|uniref:Uncharacterized protein n=1 Tax=Anas platyrhynchos TaxID=8839 RepID=R0LEF5_ANAPL|nr:hypothetical protein Anapl_04642 [Anas platyrhynchos]